MDEDAFGIRRATRLAAAALLWDQTKIAKGVTEEGAMARKEAGSDRNWLGIPEICAS